jgi:uroporphyrinogen-III synthase
MPEQIADLIRRNGGIPVSAPALREIPTHDSAAAEELINRLSAGAIQIVVFLTGVGTAALFAEAGRLNRLEELLAGLASTTNVSRGQKPWRPLKEAGVPITVTVPTPYTTTELLRTLEQLSPEGKGVALLHYGERSDVLADSLVGWGARVTELLMYEWQLPEDTGPLDRLVDEVIAGTVDAVAFTSKVQLRHLFELAGRGDRVQPLIEALNSRTVVAAVGPTTAAELEGGGVHPRVVPTNPKMGPMIVALGEYFRAG